MGRKSVRLATLAYYSLVCIFHPYRLYFLVAVGKWRILWYLRKAGGMCLNYGRGLPVMATIISWFTAVPQDTYQYILFF
jgi:hypothetical protein